MAAHDEPPTLFIPSSAVGAQTKCTTKPSETGQSFEQGCFSAARELKKAFKFRVNHFRLAVSRSFLSVAITRRITTVQKIETMPTCIHSDSIILKQIATEYRELLASPQRPKPLFVVEELAECSE